MTNNHRKSNITEHQKYSDFLSIRYLPVWLVIGFLWLLTRLPFPILLSLGRAIGRIAYHVAKKRRHVCEVNIKLCFPERSDQARKIMTKKIFISYGQGLVESAYSWLGNVEKLSSKVTFKGLEHVSQAQKDKRGILMVGGHFAILDFAGGLLGLEQAYHIVQRDHDNPLFNYFMTTSRNRHAKACIARKDLRGMVRALKEGDTVWYAPDQDSGRKNSVFVPFFNIPTATITGTSGLASLSGAAVIPVFYYRDDQGHYHIEFSAPLEIPTGNVEQDAIQFNQWLETRILEQPEQYFWLHKRFKTRPVGEPSFY